MIHVGVTGNNGGKLPQKLAFVSLERWRLTRDEDNVFLRAAGGFSFFVSAFNDKPVVALLDVRIAEKFTVFPDAPLSRSLPHNRPRGCGELHFDHCGFSPFM